jgi:hypothetical protein
MKTVKAPPSPRQAAIVAMKSAPDPGIALPRSEAQCRRAERPCLPVIPGIAAIHGVPSPLPASDRATDGSARTP